MRIAVLAGGRSSEHAVSLKSAAAVAAGLDARRLLADNDGNGFFSALGDLVVTGPTRTNVNDYRAILLA